MGSAERLGAERDPEANRRGAPCISTPGSPVRQWVIRTDEELMIAQQTRGLVA